MNHQVLNIRWRGRSKPTRHWEDTESPTAHPQQEWQLASLLFSTVLKEQAAQLDK